MADVQQLPVVSNVFTVADDILKLSKAKGRALTPLQLMKLAYIAHGFSLAILDKDLFAERIEAWRYGPVMPDLYHVTKRFGRDPIPSNLIEDTDTSITDEPGVLLREVVNKYGHLSGYQLSQLTHSVGSPWHTVYEEGVYGKQIPDSVIRDHYRRLLDERRNNAA